MKGDAMNLAATGLMIVLATVSASWAEDARPQPSEPAPAGQGDLRIQDLPKPIPELLDKLQQLSRKIEPEIAKLGSTLGKELDDTVKQLKEELQAARRGQAD
jgi:hypothetical protein